MLAVFDGYTHFLSGFADGADLEFSDIIIKLKNFIPDITLEAVLPYKERLEDKNNKLQELLKKCDKVSVISEKGNKKSYMLRNLYIAENSARVIAVFSGNKRSGTGQTIRLAGENSREIKLINLNQGK